MASPGLLARSFPLRQILANTNSVRSKIGLALLLLLSICLTSASCSKLFAVDETRDELDLIDARAEGFVEYDSSTQYTTWRRADLARISVHLMAGQIINSEVLSTPEINAVTDVSIELESPDSMINLHLSTESGLRFVQQTVGIQSSTLHFTWPVSPCLGLGEYQLTSFKATGFDGYLGFIITPAVVTIENSNLPIPCGQSENDMKLGLPVRLEGLHAQGRVKRDAHPISYNNTGTDSMSTDTASDWNSSTSFNPTQSPGSTLTQTPMNSSSTFTGASTVHISYTMTTTINGSDVIVTVTETTTKPEFTTIVVTSLETIVSTSTAPGTTVEFTAT
ncbi:uncharacterized protein LAESUDRAFT_749781 [Laetiporus sulphureus 93-53]|uniref:Uncharacterized protein n=1 Tax=Laetiporus sulphureus 93-53 TaxID=1314785 RepID=A0A165EE48_9APHY|nr:uncharacterized protein LAESUDRAFT_749781 [Laetiporus sulphureus 93-53]KZT06843.1 hypothetical protein LAESUDRAFT_749781 [Laetiporus sulphureus 93-53]